MEIETIITELQKLDLSQYPEKEIRALLNNIGKMASMQVNFHSGKVVMRARPHDNESVRFNKKSDLSFKPQQFNKSYQRASTPYETMFYATAVPDKLQPGELDSLRIIGVLESMPELRDNESSFYRKISFGKWQVVENLKLLAIVHRESYFKESSFTRELVDAYKTSVDVIPNDILQDNPDIVERSLKIQTYLADEFAKEDINHDYDYMISAIFSEIAVKNGFDGIFYPSVRVSGKGFNIAITPKATEKLRLIVAGECSLYKHKMHTVVGNDAVIQLTGNEDEFELVDLPNNFQKECLNKIGIQSLDELKKLQLK